jgi:hypothetical protein
VHEVSGNADHDGDASTECETESHKWIDGVSPRMGAMLIPFFVVGFGLLSLCLITRAKGKVRGRREMGITDDISSFDFDNPVHDYSPRSDSPVNEAKGVKRGDFRYFEKE